MLKVEGSNPRGCALLPLTAGVVSGWIYLFPVPSKHAHMGTIRDLHGPDGPIWVMGRRRANHMGPIRESHGLMWAKDIRTAKDVNGPSYMGTMCDVHGLTWAIRAHGNEVFTWAILLLC